MYSRTSSLAEGQYYLTMLNNNSGVKATRSGKSYYYKFLVDETARTYALSEIESFDQTKDEGNITKANNVYVYCNAGGNKFTESDSSGKLIKEFSVKKGLYRIYKDTWKDFWFK